VVVGVMKKGYEKILQRFYTGKRVKHDLAFSKEWKLLESNLIKKIRKGKWPKLDSKTNKILKILQSEICRLSSIGSNEMAMSLIEKYSMSILIRYIAINKITIQSGSTPGIDNFIIKNNSNKIDLLIQSKETKLSSFSVIRKVKLIEIHKPDDSLKQLGIITMLDRVLQTQLYLLLDPFYEAKYPEHMYGFRKGRNTHQAAGFLKAVLERSDINYASLILLDIEKCFDNISHEAILTHFSVPNKWKPLLVRWLKVKTVNKNNKTSLTMQKGIVQGSVIAPMICNVIITQALFKTVTNSTKLALFKDFKTTKSIYTISANKNYQRTIYRNIIVYEGNIVITTTNSDEINNILTIVFSSLLEFGLNISKTKSQVINYLKDKHIQFKYLGFQFNYVPTKHIKKGGILTRYDDITRRKFNKTQNGTYLVYPTPEKLRALKKKCKSLIKLLLKTSFVEVLNKVNLTIRGFSNYYSWSNGYNRLRSLDGFLLRYFKKYLIRKFRNKGVRRPTWVAKNFLICKTLLNPKGRFSSPYNLKWHPHTKLIKSKDNNKRFKKVLFLVMPSKIAKILPITCATLPPKIRTQPYYLADTEFAAYSAKLYSKRINTNNYKEKLFIKQKGMCPHCNIALANSDKNNFSLDIFDNDLEIHHKNGLDEMHKISKSVHKAANSYNNLVLLHKTCHLAVTLKLDSGEPSAERLAR
jgi:retron-type reverse transcriptase/5-methylcytosine-specific restriction endonuclease McrA